MVNFWLEYFPRLVFVFPKKELRISFIKLQAPFGVISINVITDSDVELNRKGV